MRRLMAGHDRKEMSELQERLAVHGGIPRDAWASRTGLRQVAHMLVAEAQRVLEGSQAHSEGRVLLSYLWSVARRLTDSGPNFATTKPEGKPRQLPLPSDGRIEGSVGQGLSGFTNWVFDWENI
jgi:hypothetical protein